MSSKLVCTFTIKNEDGTEEIVHSTEEIDIPSINDFMNGENFRENFDMLEKAILQTRKEAAEDAVKDYLEKASKKKSMKRKPRES